MYTLWWLLMGLACQHTLKHRNANNVVCAAFGICQKGLLHRWPRRKDTPQLCELVGDIIEFAFAFSYRDGQHYWHLQRVLGPIILKVRSFVYFLDHHARRERMGVDGSFFENMNSRCECTSALAIAMFNAMHVQKYSVDLSDSQAGGFLRLCMEVMLLYPASTS